MLKNIILVGSGGFLGSVMRYLTGVAIVKFVPDNYPMAATLIINITGCFLFGLITGYTQKSAALSQEISMLLAIGFCGAFTTFSAFTSDIIHLSAKAEMLQLSLYTGLSVIVGLIMTMLGRQLVLA